MLALIRNIQNLSVIQKPANKCSVHSSKIPEFYYPNWSTDVLDSLSVQLTTQQPYYLFQK